MDKKIPDQDKALSPRKYRWYSSYKFPLIPRLELKKGNEHNTNGFSFRWLFITLWTLDAVQFEFAVVADTHWGIGFTGLLPYLRWTICIPCPEKLSMWVQRNLWRKPKTLTQ